MAINSIFRLQPDQVMELKQAENKRRERCRGCSFLPLKSPESWAETDAHCDNPKSLRIGRKGCKYKKGSA